MPGMNEFLAAAYGTGQPSPAPQEDAEKVAHAELFAKLAAENGIDLSQMSEDDVAAAWNTFYSQTKTAEFPPKKKEEEEEKKEEKKEEHEEHEDKEASAKAEFEATKQAAAEWQQKTAEADFLGRQMAHAYVDELKKIAGGTGTEKEASATKTLAGGMNVGLKERMHQGARHMVDKVVSGNAGKYIGKANAAKDATKKHLEEHGKKYLAGAGAAAAGGAGFMAGKHKKASALDELAAFKAVEKVAAAGYDTEQGAELISGLLEKGAKDSVKIAGAADFNSAVELRSLELLEEAGYPVNWPES